MAVILYNRSKEPRHQIGDDGKTYFLPPRSRTPLPEGVGLGGPLEKDVKLVQQTN